jgi:DNA-binding FrmR family transcriptional regulator
MMTSVANLDSATRHEMTQRLKAIEGQARGIQRMVEDGRTCQEIMDQIMALRSASHALSIHLLEKYAIHCLRDQDDSPAFEEAISQMINVVARLTR